MDLPLFLIILLLSIASFDGLALLISGSRRKVKSGMMAGALSCLSVCFLTHFLLSRMGFLLNYPYLILTSNLILFLTGPFFYFFVRKHLFDRKFLKKKDILHFLPAFFYVLNLASYYLLNYELEIADGMVNNPQDFYLVPEGFLPTMLVNAVIVLQMLGYFVYSGYLLSSDIHTWIFLIHRLELKYWLYMGVILFGVFNFSYLMNRIFFNLDDLGIALNTGAPLNILVGNIVLAIALLNVYVHLRLEYVCQSQIMRKADGRMPRKPDTDILYLEQRNEKSTEERLFAGKVVELLEKQQRFRQKGLTVTHLAAALEVSPRVLSTVCKKKLNRTTRDLINLYRVRYAREQIISGYLDHFTLDALGKEAGFNSRITFFNAFKKEFGQSPTSFWAAFQEGKIEP